MAKLTKRSYDDPLVVRDAEVWFSGTNLLYHTRVGGRLYWNYVLKEEGGTSYIMVEDPILGWARVEFDRANVPYGNPTS
ncbi:MAG: hypothetical protein UZ22_OP11002000257 [Microgenomates bacterium OLB23]|nr:MAG: hypothetical protein UZ22_OP11002000257 [Microgenomates bacterium OLB23]